MTHDQTTEDGGQTTDDLNHPSSVVRPPSSALRHIVLCADDYGIAPGVNTAIRDLILRGRLNATSVMVVAPSFARAEAVSLAILNSGVARAAVGLHVTLTAPFRPLSKDFAPLRDGAFLALPQLVRSALLRRLDRTRLAAEIDAQLGAFAAAFGRPPDFIDGHQHVQPLPQIADEVLAAACRHAPQAWVRQCGSPRPLAQMLGDPKGLFIDVLSRGFRARAAAHGVPTNPAFAGTYNFTPRADFAALLARFLDGSPDGGVIMCHPGHVDDELARLDPLTNLRAREFAYLASEAFPAMLAGRGVALH